MKKMAIIRIIPLLAAVALLAGCSSLLSLLYYTHPDPENPKAPPYIDGGVLYNKNNQIDIESLYRQGFRKVVVNKVRLSTAYSPWDNRVKIASPAIKGTLLVTDELIKAYPNLEKQHEYGRKYDLWLQLEKESSLKGDKKSRVVVAYIKDIEGLRSIEEIEADRARRAAEEEERVALAEQIIVKKYGSLFSSYSDYKAWRQRQWQNGDQFMKSLLLNQEKTYSENDMFIVEKHKLEIRDMQFAARGGFAYLVGSIGHVGGYSRPCYFISATQIPYIGPEAIISKSLLLQYIGQDQYREGYQVKTCDVFLAFVEGTAEYANYKSMIDDLQRIERNPSEYVHILDE